MTQNSAKNLYDRATGNIQHEGGPVLHVRVMGQSRDIAMALLDVNGSANDAAVRDAVASFMDLPAIQLRDTVIERHANGNMTIRPEAVFG
jgi:hypothetical protein